MQVSQKKERVESGAEIWYNKACKIAGLGRGRLQMGRLIGIFKLFRRDLIIMLLALKNRETPGKVKGLLLAALLYLIFPVDIIPDAVPLAGIMDDAIIVPLAVEGLMKMLPGRVRSESEAQASHVLRYAPAIVAGASLFIILWLALIIFGIVKLIQAVF